MNIEQFLLEKELTKDEAKEVIISDRFADEEGTPLPFKIKQIDRLKLNELGIRAKKTGEFLDILVIEEACIEPNFKSVELQNHYGVANAYDLINKILLSGECMRLTNEICKANDILTSFDSLVDQAKK